MEVHYEPSVSGFGVPCGREVTIVVGHCHFQEGYPPFDFSLHSETQGRVQPIDLYEFCFNFLRLFLCYNVIHVPLING